MRELDRSHRIALTGGLIFDGTGSDPKRGTLLISGEIIESVDYNCETPDDFNRIDISGCTALPGFVHAHAHPGFKQLDGCDLPDYELDWLKTCLYCGITTVRDMGGLNASSAEEIFRRRDELNSQGCLPRILSAGKFIAAPGGYGGTAPVTVQSEAECRQQVTNLAAAGADFIKTSLEMGYSPGTALPTLSDNLLSAICTAAREHGLIVAAHLSQAGPLRTLVDAGITCAEHAPYDPMSDELIDRMVGRSIVLTPTLTLYRMIQDRFGAPFLGTAMENVRRFVSAGGTVAVGDDYIEPAAPWYQPGLPYGELELLAAAGMSNRQILLALTANGAAACGMASSIGALTPGKYADIAIVHGNPLEQLAHLKTVKMVIKNGKTVYPPAL